MAKIFKRTEWLIMNTNITLLAINGLQTAENNQIYKYQLMDNWDTFNKQQIEKLLHRYGKNNRNYNKLKPPYTVFDWDNTAIFGDIGEAVFMYQLRYLLYNFQPKELKNILFCTTNHSKLLFHKNVEGKHISINKIVADIIASYVWLFNNYISLETHGLFSISDIWERPHYKNFTVKMRFLYEAIYQTFSPKVAYTWVLGFFTGLNSDDIRHFTRLAIKWQLTEKIETVVWQSPNKQEIGNQFAGQVKTEWKNGLRFIPEIQHLFAAMRNAGFDIWICSASHTDIVKEIASNPDFGYNINENNIIAMELRKTNEGKILPKIPDNFIITHGKGKTLAINKFLSGENGRYGYEPVLVAGDSEGDQDMLNDFPEMKIGLIINRPTGENKLIGQLRKRAKDSYGNPDAKYLLVER